MDFRPWDEIAEDRNVHLKPLNPLDQFIYDNEPADEMRAIDFRAQLSSLIDFITRNDQSATSDFDDYYKEDPGC